MPKEKRNLLNALVATPEVDLFLGNGKANQKNSHPSAKKKNKVKPTKPKDEIAKNRLTESRTPIGARVQSSLAKELIYLAAKRKLAGKFPWYQRDIIEEAIKEWVSNNK